jgi:hypothetical protein
MMMKWMLSQYASHVPLHTGLKTRLKTCPHIIHSFPQFLLKKVAEFDKNYTGLTKPVLIG